MNKVSAFINELEIEEMMANGKYEEALPILLDVYQGEDFLNKESILSNIALCFLYKKNYVEAIHYLEKLLAINSNNTTAIYNIAYAYVQLKKYEKAIEYFKLLEKNGGMNYDAFYNMGIAYLGMNQIDRTMACFFKLMEGKNIQPEIIYNAGLQLISLNYPEKAREFFTHYLAIFPNEMDATFGLGIAYYQLREYRKAIECLSRVVSWDVKRYPSASVSLGMAFFQIGDVTRALHYLTEATQFNIYESWYYLGIVYESMEQLEKALACYRKALVLGADVPDLYEKEGNVLLKLSRIDEAKKSFRMAFEFSKKISYLFHVGLVALSQRKYEEAFEAFRFCLNNYKDTEGLSIIDIHQNLAICCYYLEKFEETIFHSQHTIELDNSRELVYYVMGSSLMKIGKLEEAENILKAGLRFCEDDVNLLYTLGILEGNLENFNSSEEYLEKALKISRNPEILYALALTRMKLNKKESAAELLEEFKAYHKEETEVLYKLGLLFIELRDYKKAERAFEDFLSIKPGDEKAIGYLKSLRKEDKFQDSRIETTGKKNFKFSKFFLVGLTFFALYSCSQEHLIFFKNITRARFISFKDILKESGFLKEKKESVTNKILKKIEPVEEEVQQQKIPSQSKQIMVPEGKEFSVSLPFQSNFVVLKDVKGDVRYLKESSRPDRGIFMFQSGRKDSKISFQQFNLNGELEKNINYYVKVLLASNQIALQSSSSAKSSSSLPPKETEQISNTNTSLSLLITTTLGGLTPSESISELRKMLSSEDFSEDDKEIIRYKLIEILIEQSRFKNAHDEVELLKNRYKKAYYLGEIYFGEKSYKESLRYFIDALNGDDDTKKAAILGAEALILKTGAADKSLIERLASEIKKFKKDKRFYAEAMIGIGRIYQYVPDVYSAKDIYDSIVSGDYDEDIKEKARTYSDELKKEFLDYR